MLGQKDDFFQKLVCRLKAIFGKLVARFLVLVIIAWIIPILDGYWWKMVGVIKRYWWTHGHILPWMVAHYWRVAAIVILIFIYRNFGWLKRKFKCCKSAICKIRKQKRDLDSAIPSDENEKRSGKADKDELCRGDFITYLGNIVEAIEDDATTYIGLYGSWGSGKSWILKEFIKHCKSREKSKLIDIVVFNPWQVADTENLSYKLVETIAKNVCIQDQCLGALIRKYGNVLGLTPHRGIFDKLPFIGKWLSNCLDRLYDVGQVKHDVSTALIGYGRRIVVAIEDMDRLDYSEIRELIRIIRTNCDIPNVTYMLLADEQYLAAALGEKIGGEAVGRQYLQKIVDFPCHLPSVPNTDLFSAYKQRIVRYGRGKCEYDISNEDIQRLGMISGLFLTMRDVERASKGFVSNMSRQKAKSKDGMPNVDWVDMAALSAIEALETGLYKNLREIYWDLYNITNIEEATKIYTEEWMQKTVLQSVNPRRKGAVQLFLKIYMGIVYKIGVDSSGKANGCYYGIDNSSPKVTLAKHYLASPCCIENYFTGKDCETCLPNVDQSEFIAMAAVDYKKAFSVVKRIAADGKLAYLVQVLDDYIPPSSGDALVNYATSLMLVADEHWGKEQLFVAPQVKLTPGMDLYKSISNIVDGAFEYRSLQHKEFVDALQKSKSFSVGLFLVGRYWNDIGGYRFNIKDKDKFGCLKNSIDIMLANALDAFETGALQRHPYSIELQNELCRLITECANEEIVAKFRNVYDKLSEFNSDAPLCIVDACTVLTGDAPNWPLQYGINYDKFLKTMGAEKESLVIAQLESLSNLKKGGLSAHERMLYNKLKELRNKKMNGLPYDVVAQKEELRVGANMA